ncbi:MAG: hypothetical protein Q9160_007184 [Pyrenula sp. 1 TL-2023]
MGQIPSPKQMAGGKKEPRPSLASHTPDIEALQGPDPNPIPKISVSSEGQEQEFETSGDTSSGDPNRNPSVASTQSSDPDRLNNIEEVRRAFTVGRAMQALGGMSETLFRRRKQRPYRIIFINRDGDVSHKSLTYHSALRLIDVADFDFLDIAPASAGTDGAADTPAVAPTKSSADPASASQPKDTIATQGSNAPTSDPNAQETAAIKESKDNAEAALNKKTDPTSADTAATKTTITPAAADSGAIDAAKPDAVKEAKVAPETPKAEPTTPSQTAAKGTPSKDSTKSKGSVREKLRGIKGKLPFGKKKSEGSSGLSQG